MRPAVLLVVLLGVAAVGLFGAARAPASRIQAKATPPIPFVGHDWVGKVSLEYGDDSGAEIFNFKFANLCSRSGSQLKESVTISVGKNKLFHYHGHGFTVSGNVIGSPSSPKEIAGLASVSSHGCESGPWWFGVTPKPL